MKRYVAFALVLTTLVGCGAGDRVPDWRSYSIINNTLCFSVDKSDVLSRYVISSTQEINGKALASEDRVSLSWPDTCVKVPLTNGYIYQTAYTLNGVPYRYNFFIDNNGRIVSTRAGEKE